MQRGQIHSPLGISGSGGLRQCMWYDEGHESQQSSSPPSLQTRQNSMWWSSSSMSPVSTLSSSPSEPSSLASHWMPSFSCNCKEKKFIIYSFFFNTIFLLWTKKKIAKKSIIYYCFDWHLMIFSLNTVHLWDPCDKLKEKTVTGLKTRKGTDAES